jgi:tetratricopeptide (TPR) repeat protein
LTDLSLLDVQQADLTSTPRYVLHPLVRTFAAAQLVEQADFEQVARERWITWYVELISKVGHCWNDLGRLSLLDAEQLNAMFIIENLFQAQRFLDILCISNGNHDFTSDGYRVEYGISYYYYVRGLWNEKIKVDTIFADSAKKLANAEAEIVYRTNLISIYCRQESIAAAEQELYRLTILMNHGEVSGYSHACFYRARADYFFAQKDYDAAFTEWEKSVPFVAVTSIPLYISSLSWSGVCLYRIGRLSEALEIFQSTLREAQKYAFTSAILSLLDWIAKIHIAEKRFAEAEKILVETCYTARQESVWLCVAFLSQGLAQIYIYKGDSTSACKNLLEAIDLFERLGKRRELAEAREELARLEAQIAAAAE